MRKHTETIPQPADSRFDSLRRHRAGLVIRYAMAAISISVVLMLTDRLRETFQGTPNSLFFCAMILSGWYGGFGPGILASLRPLRTVGILMFVLLMCAENNGCGSRKFDPLQAATFSFARIHQS